MSTGKPPTCPKCGATDGFIVWVPERVPFTWSKSESGGEWHQRGDEPEMLGGPYIVQCTNDDPVCDHEFEADPWD